MALATLSIDVEARLAKLEEGLDRASRIVQRSSADMQRRFDGINAAAIGLSRTLATGFAVTGLALFTREALRGLDALNDFKDATGASIENASALEDVAARTGTSFDTATQAVVRLNKVLGDAKPGSAQAEILRSIGLSAEELRRADPVEALQQVAQALNGYADNGKRARLAQELFGKSITEVGALLKDLAENGKLVPKVLSEQAEQAERFNKQLSQFSKNITDAGRSFLSTLLPSLNKAAEDFRKAEFGALDLLKALNKLGTFAIGGALADKLGNVAGSTELERLQQIAVGLEAVKKSDEDAGRAENQLNSRRLASYRSRIAALQAVETAQKRAGQVFDPSAGVDAIRAIKPDAPDIPDAAKAAKAAKFPTAAGAADGALQAALQRLQGTDFAKIQDLRDELQRLIEIRDQLGTGGGIDQAIASITDELEQMSPAAQAAADAQRRLNDLLAETPSVQLDKTRRDMEFLADAFKRGQLSAEQFTEAVQTRLGTLPDNFKDAADEMTEFARQAARNIQDSLGDGLKQLLKGNFDDIDRLFGNLLLDLVSQAAAAQIGKALFGDFVKGGSLGGFFGSFLGSANGNAFDRAGVMAFAAGGVFNSPTAFSFGGGRLGVMGEAGPEAVMPLKRGRDGKLGVATSGGGGIVQNFSFSSGVPRAEVYAVVEAANRELVEQLRAAGRL